MAVDSFGMSSEEAKAKSTAWAVTYADLVTLLLTFFILLLVILNDAEEYCCRRDYQHSFQRTPDFNAGETDDICPAVRSIRKLVYGR